MSSTDKSVIVTGGTGFLGRHLVRELLTKGYIVKYFGSKFDLTEVQFKSLINDKVTPKYIINLAAVVGGIGANQDRAAEFTLKNLKIGLNVVDGCLSNKTFVENGKLVQIGTVCSYPKHCRTPFREEDIWNGYPEETNAGYGIAKKSIMELTIQLSKAKQLNAINLIPVNLYGPEDNFDDKKSHVIPALIKKFYNAKKNNSPNVEIWGTGYATREFLYVKDAAKAIVLAMEKHNDPMPVNIGTGVDISIRDLAYLIKKIVGYDGFITFNTSKPDGQPKRLLDVTKAQNLFGFTAKTKLEEGLKETIEWYIEKCKE